MRPLDAGIRTEDELRDTIPRYADLAAPLTAMIEGFEARAPGTKSPRASESRDA